MPLAAGVLSWIIARSSPAFDEDVHLHDRFIAPEMQSYTPFFRVGHDILIPTKIGDAEPRLFIIDTGAFSSSISPDAAREFTSLGYDIGLRVEGLSGD
jgi:hypothetical protein